MASIYDISNWNVPASSTYKKNDIVKHGGYYWYALKTVPASQTPAIGSQYWGGMANAPSSSHASASNITAPHFIWIPSYNISVNHAPRSKSIRFGDGYEQRFKDGINNDLINISLNFEGRNTQEARAILHFLDARSGVDLFFFRPPSPHDARRKFICKEFSSNVSFQDVVDISASFEQVP